jgi:hypothetical protein
VKARSCRIECGQGVRASHAGCWVLSLCTTMSA